MSYTVNVSTTDTNVTTTVFESPVTITPDGDQPVTVVDTTTIVETTSELSTTTIYTDAIELLVDDFANYFKGDWVSGTVYRRGELVNSLYSLYVCNTGTNTTITSTVAPAQDQLNWRQVVWKEAPFASLTVTTTATVQDLVVGRNFVMGSGEGSGLTINSTATFNGPAFFNDTASFNQDVEFNQLSVDTLQVAGLYYPTDKGQYGQVLTTNGETTSSWVNLGDLVFWSLSNDLYTNSYDIISNSPTARLAIGSAVTGTPENVFKQAIVFEPNNNYFYDNPDQELNSDQGISKTNHISIYNLQDSGEIKVKASRTRVYGQNSLEIGLDRYAVFGDPQYTVMRMNEDGTIFRNDVTFDDTVDVKGILDVSSIRFNDGSVQTKAPVVLTTATASVLGGIKVGEFLSINSSTGVLTINTATLSAALPDNNYVLPIASTSTLGGVKINGNGIGRTFDGTLFIDTSTIYLSPATTSTFGVVKIGDNISINKVGAISVNDASSTASGVIRVDGTTIQIVDGIASVGYIPAQGFVVKDEGTSVNNTTTVLNFVGSAISVTALGDTATITVNASNGVQILEEGTNVKSTATNINFTGGLVTVEATTDGVDVDIDIDLGLRNWSDQPYSAGTQVWATNNLWTRRAGGTDDGGVPGGSGSFWIKNGQLGTTAAGGQPGIFTYGTGLRVTDSTNLNTLHVNTASSTVLGGIKIGQGLSIDPDTGVVNVSNTASITDLVNDLYINDYAIKYKTGETGALSYSTATNQTGAPIIATRLESDSNTGLTLRENDTLLQSNSNLLRFQKFASGSSLQLSNTDSGSLSMTSTNVTLTAVNTLTLAGGAAISITAPAMLVDVDDITVDAIDVDITANNFTVYAATVFTGSVDFAAETTIGNTTTELTLRGTNILAQSSGYTRIGSNNTSSNLHVRAIYNYDGTFAPFFPAGVQYQDQTVQRTAWRGYDQGLI
jgi:hypothetical protein